MWREGRRGGKEGGRKGKEGGEGGNSDLLGWPCFLEAQIARGVWGHALQKIFMVSEVCCLESVVYIVAKVLGGREKNGLWQHGGMKPFFL